MAEERIDLRTPREVAYDLETERIVARFRELMEYAPSASRAMDRVAQEWHTSRVNIRHRLVRSGAYIPGSRRGRNNGYQVMEK